MTRDAQRNALPCPAWQIGQRDGRDLCGAVSASISGRTPPRRRQTAWLQARLADFFSWCWLCRGGRACAPPAARGLNISRVCGPDSASLRPGHSEDHAPRSFFLRSCKKNASYNFLCSPGSNRGRSSLQVASGRSASVLGRVRRLDFASSGPGPPAGEAARRACDRCGCLWVWATRDQISPSRQAPEPPHASARQAVR